MQDRLNFRFWDTKERVMLDWDCVCQTAFNCTRKEGNKMQRYGLMYLVFTTPQRFIPLQCTGLRDKNGMLIYEGDIIKGLCIDYICTVVWKEAEFALKSEYGSYIGFNTPEEIVIGNIYENPELLEENNAQKIM